MTVADLFGNTGAIILMVVFIAGAVYLIYKRKTK
jgi:LPXTG-motif cell wall-anchored protein